MRFVLGEPIYALASPPGEGAVALIRLSGNNVFDIVSTITRSNRIFLIEPRKLFLEHIFYGEEPLDRVLIAKFISPYSYTGEDVVEIYTHGNPLIVEKVFELLEESGARLAEPGEFTYRAFANGKMSLEEAEAVNFLVRAKTLEGVKNSLKTLEGDFHKIVKKVLDQLLEIAVHLETDIEFPEEEVEVENMAGLRGKISSLLKYIDGIVEGAEDFKMMVEGVKVVLAGPPNAGKSSLFNALIGKRRAIVTETPGTTRDYLEAEVRIKGYPFVLYDTAGLRETQDRVERAGIELAVEVFSGSDLVVFLVDGSRVASVEDVERELAGFKDLLGFEESSKKSVKVVVSKADLMGMELKSKINYLKVSVITGEGLEELKDFLSKFASAHIKTSAYSYALSERVISALKAVRGELREAIKVINSSAWYELAAEHLRNARSYLAEITGEDVSESLLDSIFSNFCIGK